MFSSMLSLLGSLRGGSSFITRSLRFRSSASAFLNRTFTATPTTYTLSFWLKRGSLGSQVPFGSRLSGTGASTILFTASDAIEIGFNNITRLTTTSVYRDISAWYHFVVSVTNNGNVVLYSNGNQVGSAAAGSNPFLFNSSWTNTIGRPGDSASFYFDGYLTDVNFIDGQALTPASFGAIDSSTGVWAPRPYSGTYGTNGFYLKFGNTSSVAALGTDSSGNGNTWTVNNVSLTAGATYDSMIDVPVNYADGGNGRGNYAVLNPLSYKGSFTFSNANLTATSSSASSRVVGNIAVNSGKYYAEVNATGSENAIGIIPIANVQTGNTNEITYANFNGIVYKSGVAQGAAVATWGAADIIGIALDLDLQQVSFYKNNIFQKTVTLAADVDWTFEGFQNTNLSTTSITFNFGQRPFAYTPPAGFRALNTNNLPTPSIVNGANFMAATTYTGNAAARSLSNAVNSVSFQPDLVWIKSRTPGATSHALFDSTRGTTKYLSSNTTAAETTNANTLTAFNGDGFSLGADTTLVNANANSYVAWQWRESITAGLDVVSYTGTGVNRTVAHNLGVAPKMVIVKNLSTVDGWAVYHVNMNASPATGYLALNETSAFATQAVIWNNTAPSPTTLSVGTSSRTNASTNNYVAYCFAEIAGFSKFGSYTGNGLADGPFVFCGFRPRFVMIKRTDGLTNWEIFDSSRDSSNAMFNELYPNSSSTENASTLDEIDFASNGVKFRSSNGIHNASGGTYIFAAFAEVPSKYALAR